MMIWTVLLDISDQLADEWARAVLQDAGVDVPDTEEDF